MTGCPVFVATSIGRSMHINILVEQTVYLVDYKVIGTIDSVGGSLYTANQILKRDTSGT